MGRFVILCCFLLFFFFVSDRAFANIWTRREMVEMAGYGEQKLSSVIITGSLLCHTSLPHLHSIPIQGAIVAIKCHTGFKTKTKWIKTVTDDSGRFEIDLPSELHAIPDIENTCFIKPLYVPKPYRCYHTSTNVHKRIKLVSSSDGFRVYTSGSGSRRRMVRTFLTANARSFAVGSRSSSVSFCSATCSVHTETCVTD